MRRKVARQRKKEIWVASRLPISVPLDPPQDLEVEVVVEGGTGVVRITEFVPASSSMESFAETLLCAIEQPIPPGASYRPGVLVVDRAELAMAVRALTLELGIEVEVQPQVKTELGALIEEMEEHLSEGPDYGFLRDDDVDPKLVGDFFAQAHAFLSQSPWETIDSDEVLEIDGLSSETVLCSILGHGGEYGLAVYLSRDSVEMFFTGQVETGEEAPSLAVVVIDPQQAEGSLREEMDQHGWKGHALGIPILLRGDRPDRPHPTNDELRMVTKVLEVARLFAEDPEGELPFEISSGEVVKVAISEELVGEWEPFSDFEGPIQAIMTLDALWQDGEIHQAAGVASAYLDRSKQFDPPIVYRLALYLCQLGELAALKACWPDLAQGDYAEWHYVEAFLEAQQGMMLAAESHLQRGYASDASVARRLLGEADADDFALLWAPMWAANKPALELLQSVAGAKSDKSASSKKAKARTGRKAKPKAKAKAKSKGN